MGIKRFEDILAWQEARVLTRLVYSATRSATEVQSHCYAALDQNYLAQETFDSIYSQATKTKNLILAFRRYLKTSPTSKVQS